MKSRLFFIAFIVSFSSFGQKEYTNYKFEIDADSTSIPEIEYVVKGKMLEWYNYDNTYVPDFALNGSDSDTNFDAGDLVTVEYSTDGSSWTTDTSGNHASGKFKIMDKYLFTTNRNVSFILWQFSIPHQFDVPTW